MTRESSPTLIVHARGVLFDMDGVLISSTSSDERCWVRWARFHGMEGTFDVQSTHGRRAVDSLRALRPDLDLSVELKRLEDFDMDDHDGISILPGVQRLISSLPAGSWTIVTSASEQLMRNRLEFVGIEGPPEVVSADAVSHGKPDSEPYHKGAAILGLHPSECLVIEDSPPGIKSGRAAGCKVLAVLTSHAADNLAEADWIVPSLDHVTAGQESNGTIAIQLDRPIFGSTHLMPW